MKSSTQQQQNTKLSKIQEEVTGRGGGERWEEKRDGRRREMGGGERWEEEKEGWEKSIEEEVGGAANHSAWSDF